MLLELVVGHVLFRQRHASAHGDAGCVHRVGIARHQRVPPVQVAAVGEEPVGAGRRQPGDAAHRARREPHAVAHLLLPVLVVAAAAALRVEQPAGDVGEEGRARALLLQLVEAAAPAAVAQAFPFARAHLLERLAPPERGFGVGHDSKPFRKGPGGAVADNRRRCFT